MRRTYISAAIALAAVAAIGVPAVAAHASSDPDVLYKSTVSPLPQNLPSVGFQANQTSEFGNQVVFTKAAQPLSSVIVTMSSWGCQSGSWVTKDCVTTPGATFTEPITLNLYNANAPGSTLPGTLITSMTKTFKLPYRPSTSPNCAGVTGNGGWGRSCVSGKAANITFNFSKQHVNLPSSIVFGIAYNTSQYGYLPYGTQPCESTAAGCAYDSLNVALSQDPTNVTKGSDPNPGKVFWNTATASDYCDGGPGGTFRLDSPGSVPSDQCWSVGAAGTSPYYVPAVQFLEG